MFFVLYPYYPIFLLSDVSFPHITSDNRGSAVISYSDISSINFLALTLWRSKGNYLFVVEVLISPVFFSANSSVVLFPDLQTIPKRTTKQIQLYLLTLSLFN